VRGDSSASLEQSYECGGGLGQADASVKGPESLKLSQGDVLPSPQTKASVAYGTGITA
jgi:hypothetical protein